MDGIFYHKMTTVLELHTADNKNLKRSQQVLVHKLEYNECILVRAKWFGV